MPLRIDVDTRALIAALDAVPAGLAVRLKGEARYTAVAVSREAHSRVARRTGKTADKITVEETHNGEGFVVFVGRPRKTVATYLEYGTKHMSARPFLHASARVEEGGHQRRVQQAIRDVIAAEGLGD